MRRAIIIIIFLIGLGVFSYPMISNILSTQVHQSVVKEYAETVEKMDKKEVEQEKKKADNHNKKLENSEVDFVDPFSEEGSKGNKAAGNKSYYDALNIAPAIGSIEIPKIGSNLPIYHGTGEDVLSRGVGHLENSSLPTGKPGTHSVLTAHRGLPSAELFRNLDELGKGDQFFVNVLDESYAYEVYDVEVVLPHETQWLQTDDNEEYMTLLTCEPYMLNTHRMLVKGKRVPYDESMKSATEEVDTFNYWYLVGAGIVFILILFWLWSRRKRKNKVERS
ncbi:MULTISPECIES: class C sortase [Clostridia]|uniref:class C sortase n=1 Tax=Clostridia TaxID=186801 RepID=UPI000EA2EEBB|nr:MULTISPECIES: class C sortase [Clostridia]NBJ68117.1 class C sortase [Roseburia sp. 1XD42-34]RKI81892.1 class C sortase [Clostridium sp. 1xD42-85]